MKIPKVLSIAGSDSGAGAGTQADLKTLAAFEVYGTSVITAVTAQNTSVVRDIHPIPATMVSQQIEAVLSDIGADAIKTGMLANAEIIEAVTSTLRRYPEIPLVTDPVMVAKSGDSLLAPEAIQMLQRLMFPLALVVTPNIPEAEVLVGRRLRKEEDLLWAAQTIREMGPQIVILKGGHAPARVQSGTVEVWDLFFDAKGATWIRGPFIDTPHTHGTGCTFASAIAAGLAKGLAPYQAAQNARRYLTGALQKGYAVGSGKGPVHHFHHWWTEQS